VTRTVLITGVGGFVGSHVVEDVLSRTDWHVVGVDSFAHNGEFVRLLDVAGHDTSRVTALVHDLNAPLSTRTVRDLAGVDLVVNVASRSHVTESIHEPAEFVLNNVRLAVHVLELCRQIRPCRLVHVSTDEVHGPDRHTWPVEHRPSSPYAASKAAQADLVWAYARTYDIPSTIVASANMVGERQGGGAFVPLIVRKLFANEALRIDTINGVPGERAYTYVRNVASRIVDVMVDGRAYPDDPDDDPVEYLTLRGQARLNNLVLAERVANLAGRPLRWYAERGELTRPGYDPTYADVGDPWIPAIDFDDGLERTVNWLAANLDRYEEIT
jgi:dTDP-glucose 4,6-dehydratase